MSKLIGFPENDPNSTPKPRRLDLKALGSRRFGPDRVYQETVVRVEVGGKMREVVAYRYYMPEGTRQWRN